MYFAKLSTDGEIVWHGYFDDNIIFGSSPTLGTDGNIYVSHDGLSSLTQDGYYRWFIPTTGYSHNSPAIGFDGKIYSAILYPYNLCAFLSSGVAEWCFTGLETGYNNVSVGHDGAIYQAGMNSTVTKFSPSGEILWTYTVDAPKDETKYVGDISISAEDNLYFFYGSGIATKAWLYSIDSHGNFRWKKEFSKNFLTGSGENLTHPIHLDREANLYFCLTDSSCYGIDQAGNTLWQYEFPLVDSIVMNTITEPLLAANGLMYVLDSQANINAFVDPGVYPVLQAAEEEIILEVNEGVSPFNHTLGIASSLSPLAFSASTGEAGWISVQPDQGMTPSQLSLTITPGSLPPGEYFSDILLRTEGQFGMELKVVVKLLVKRSNLPNRSSYTFQFSLAGWDIRGRQSKAGCCSFPNGSRSCSSLPSTQPPGPGKSSPVFLFLAIIQ